MCCLRSEIAFETFSHWAMWLRRYAASRQLVTAIGYQDFLKHNVGG
jgi:hypothetical protein